MEDIKLLGDEIVAAFRTAGLEVLRPSCFEVLDQSRVYVYPTFGENEHLTAGDLGKVLIKLEELLKIEDIPMDLRIVCQSAGSFAFLVSLRDVSPGCFGRG